MNGGLELVLTAIGTGIAGRVFFGKPWLWVPRAIGRTALRLALSPLHRRRW